MGFFSRLFSAKESSKESDIGQLSVRTTTLDFSAKLCLENVPFDEEADESDEVELEYRAELEYVVFDEARLKWGIADDDLDQALNDLFYLCLTAFGSRYIRVLDGEWKEYEKQVLEKYNDSLKDWGVKGLRLTFVSLVQTEAYRADKG